MEAIALGSIVFAIVVLEATMAYPVDARMHKLPATVELVLCIVLFLEFAYSLATNHNNRVLHISLQVLGLLLIGWLACTTERDKGLPYLLGILMFRGPVNVYWRLLDGRGRKRQ